MAESLQHKLDRVRRPRVQITYDVETGGAMRKVELPFVVGVLADLSGQPKQPLKPLKERKAVKIDRDNFNDVLARATPRVAMKVPNKLTDPGTNLAVELQFRKIDDFEPAKVAEQIGPLRKLLEMREELNQLLSKMEGNDELEQLLDQILRNKDQAAGLVQRLRGEAGASEPAPAKSASPPPARKEPVAKAPPKPAAAPPKAAPAPAPAAEEAMDPDLAALLGQTEEPAAPAAQPGADEMDPDLADLLKGVDDKP